jgi:hypothetical protein
MGQQLAERLVGRQPRVEPGGRLPEEDRQGGAGHGRPDGPEASAAKREGPAGSDERGEDDGPGAVHLAQGAEREQPAEPGAHKGGRIQAPRTFGPRGESETLHQAEEKQGAASARR